MHKDSWTHCNYELPDLELYSGLTLIKYLLWISYINSGSWNDDGILQDWMCLCTSVWKNLKNVHLTVISFIKIVECGCFIRLYSSKGIQFLFWEIKLNRSVLFLSNSVTSGLINNDQNSHLEFKAGFKTAKTSKQNWIKMICTLIATVFF